VPPAVAGSQLDRRSGRIHARRWAASVAAFATVGLMAADGHAQTQPSAADAGQTAPARPDPEVKPAAAPGTPRARPTDAEPAWQREPRQRRSGFMAGISLGFGVGQAAGYPNDAKKIGREAFYTQTDVGIGGNASLVIGVALADWLVFGFGLTSGSMVAGDLESALTAVTFRTEVFPLWSFGGAWREVGMSIDAGTGAATVHDTTTDEKLVDGGAVSRLGFGGFYEGIRLWRLSMGPFGGGNYAFSSTARRGEFLAGWRTVLYAGP
jgi:hypothetical protein